MPAAGTAGPAPKSLKQKAQGETLAVTGGVA